MKIFIQNLTFNCIIGLLQKERKIPQKVLIDICIKSEKFIDYSKVCIDVENLYKEKKFFTLEQSLKKTIKFLKKRYPKMQQIKIKIKKPTIIHNAIVGAKLKKTY